jgi:ppGpp synthetase/RelA/SpoT-type nucleotidyltranferase
MNKEEKIIEISEKIRSRIESEIIDLTKKAGIYCRIFSRVKEVDSINKKMTPGRYDSGIKMQDLLGVRIIFYFHEDVDIFKRYLKYNFKYEYDSESTTLSDIEQDEYRIESIKGGLQDKLFMPTRLNVVFKGDEELNEWYDALFVELKKKGVAAEYIDYTFEVQFRTVLSEGWHEVEHDLRYKCKEAWKGMTEESRILNGLYASLETEEHAMELLFTQMARKYYKDKNWEAMLRSIVKIHLHGNDIAPEISKELKNKNSLSKAILRIDREVLIYTLLSIPNYDLSFDNIILLVNHLQPKHGQSQALVEYAENHTSGLEHINGAAIKKKISNERKQDKYERLVERTMDVSYTKSSLGTKIYTLAIKPEIIQLKVDDVIKKYERYAKSYVIIVDLQNIEAIKNKIFERYIAPLVLSADALYCPLFFRWNKLQKLPSIEASELNHQIATGIKKLINHKISSKVIVPNRNPAIILQKLPQFGCFGIALEDNLFVY